MHQITPCIRDLPWAVTVPQPVTKFPSYYRTWSFIAVLTTARHMPCPEPNYNNRYPLAIFLKIDFNIMFQAVHFLRVSLPKTVCICISATCPAHLILFDLSIWRHLLIAICSVYRITSLVSSQWIAHFVRPWVWLPVLTASLSPEDAVSPSQQTYPLQYGLHNIIHRTVQSVQVAFLNEANRSFGRCAIPRNTKIGKQLFREHVQDNSDIRTNSKSLSTGLR